MKRPTLKILGLVVISFLCLCSLGNAESGVITADSIKLKCDDAGGAEIAAVLDGQYLRGGCWLIFVKDNSISAAFPVHISAWGIGMGLDLSLKLQFHGRIKKVDGLTPYDLMQSYHGIHAQGSLISGEAIRWLAGTRNDAVLESYWKDGAIDQAGVGVSGSYFSVSLTPYKSGTIPYLDLESKYEITHARWWFDIEEVAKKQLSNGIDWRSQIHIINK